MALFDFIFKAPGSATPQAASPQLADGQVAFDTYASVELRVGTVVSAEPVSGSDKLYRLEVDLGEEEPRQVLSGIRKAFAAEELVGKQFAFVANLPPRKMMGLESYGMILAADAEDGLALVSPTKQVPAGSRLH